jgi:hypothetical protein
MKSRTTHSPNRYSQLSMQKLKIIFILLNLVFLNCGNSKKEKVEVVKTKQITESDLIHHVKLAINPKYQDWVLFKNGTYIIFDNADTIPNLENEAIKQIKEFGPVHIGGPAGDFNVIHLNQTEGWVVSGHGYGMYTYVNPKELKSEKPNDAEIGLFGRGKRDLDSKKPIITYINRKK